MPLSKFTFVIPLIIVLVTYVQKVLGQDCNSISGECIIGNLEINLFNLPDDVISEDTFVSIQDVASGDTITVEPLNLTTLYCDEVSFSLDFSEIYWCNGEGNSFLHGFSLSSESDILEVVGSTFADWIYLESVTGFCSGETFGPGYFHDAFGTDPLLTGNNSSIHVSGVCFDTKSTVSFEAFDSFLTDGDPSDNWGFLCDGPNFACPNFSFDVTLVADTLGAYSESLIFVLTEDGLSGGYGRSNDCIFYIEIPINVECLGCQTEVEISVSEELVCAGDLIELNAEVSNANGGVEYLWNTGEDTRSIIATIDELSVFELTVIDEAGCESSSIITVDPVSNEVQDWEDGLGSWIEGGEDGLITGNETFANSGTHSYLLKDNTETSILTSRSFDLTGLTSVDVAFNYITDGFDTEEEDFWLQVSTDNGESFTTIEEWNFNDEFINLEREFEFVRIEFPFNEQTVFRFRCDASGNNDRLYIDDLDLQICQMATCDDGILNGDELDIDCGGSFCPPCTVGTEPEVGSEFSDEIKIFPNPTTGRAIIIEHDRLEEFSRIGFYRPNGQLFTSRSISPNSSSMTFNLDFPFGFYVMVLSSPERKVYGKLIIVEY